MTLAVRNALGQFAGPNPGRPRQFQDITAFEDAIEGYFQAQATLGRPGTLTGLARVLGCDRATIAHYEQYGDKFTENDAAPFVSAIKRARVRCEEMTVEQLLTPKSGVHPAGPIFVLKNNHGYKDVQTQEIESRSVVLGVMVTAEAHRAELESIDAQIRQALAPAKVTEPALCEPSASVGQVLHSVTVEPTRRKRTPQAKVRQQPEPDRTEHRLTHSKRPSQKQA